MAASCRSGHMGRLARRRFIASAIGDRESSSLLTGWPAAASFVYFHRGFLAILLSVMRLHL